jgi:hypothetical protein
MAHYVHLRIYTQAFAVLKEMYQRIPKFEKQYKYFLGERMMEDCVSIIKSIIRANGLREKEPRQREIENLCLEIEMLITDLRIANELRQWRGEKQYLYLSEMAVDLAKQAESWKKYVPQNAKS